MNILSIDQHIVGFIDLLGFSKLVEKTSHNPENPEELNKLFGIHRKTLSLNQSDPDLQITQFSDSVILSTPIEKTTQKSFSEFLKIISSYQYLLLEIGILSRGGIMSRI